MKILALTKYGPRAASTRQRIDQYIPWLAVHGVHVEVSALLGDDYVSALATGARISRWSIASAYLKRTCRLLMDSGEDIIWVYAEALPYLPARFEALALRKGRPLVYDIDDAFFENYDRRRGLSGLLLRGKLDALMRSAAICCCGNQYLKDHVERLGGRAIILPTVVDTDRYTPAASAPTNRPVIGWIGSPSTWKYVRPYLPVLRELVDRHHVRFRAVGAGRIPEADKFVGMELIEWDEATEIDEVRRMDIGIMPLPDEPWARGKSGYKLVQYMACGLPVVASPVGVNTSIVDGGINGFLATNEQEWRIALTRLIETPSLCAAFGEAGRRKVVSDYSLRSQAPRLLWVLKSVCPAASQVA